MYINIYIYIYIYIYIAYDNNQFTPTSNIKFLDIYIHTYINDKINWKYHIEHIFTNLGAVCCIMRSIKPYVSKYFANSLLLQF